MNSTLSLSYEMTDDVAARAARENCIAFAEEHFRRKDILIVAGSAAIFVLAVFRSGHWLWWIAAFPPIVFAVLLVSWLLCLAWLPRRAVARLARLPHRIVTLELTDANFVLITSVARLELAWSELKGLQPLPSFWLLCTQAGAKIPVPVNAMSPEHLAFVNARIAGTIGCKASRDVSYRP